MKLLFLVFMVLIYQQIVKAPPVETSRSDDEPASKRKKYDGSRCELTFSEIKLGWKQEIDTCPFIELKSACQKRPGQVPKSALSNYLMVIIQREPLSLVMVVSFKNLPHDGTKSYVVIGSPCVNNVDISLAAAHVQTIFSKTVSSKMLPTSADNAYTVLLLRDLNRSEARQFNLIFDLNRQLTARRLTQEQLQILRNKVVDMVVLGETETIKMQEFEYFWRIKTAPMFSESWKQIQTEDTSMSLSMCKSDYTGFDAEAFTIKPESPGGDNICQPILTFDLDEDMPPQAYAPQVSRQVYHRITADKLQSIRTENFLPIWIEKCQTRFPKKSQILENESIQKWINFNDEKEECKFTCKTCKSFLEIGFRPDIKAKSKIITTGYLSPDIYENGNSIKNHLQSDLHQDSVEFYEKLKQSTTEEEVVDIIHNYESKEMEIFNATMNVILITYSEIKAGLSFQTHEKLMTAIRKTGANVGRKHHTDDAPPVIAKVLARSFHQKLLSYLTRNGQTFSIMIDSSTSFSMPFLSVYIQVLEDGYPASHFYSLIHMEEGEASREMSEYFIKQIRQDEELVPGFENYFKTRIVAFSSDGAAVMTGGKQSFKTYLSEYVERDIPNIICLTHKLDSAYKQGIKPDRAVIARLDEHKWIDVIRKWQLSFFEAFEQTLNELYTFYQSRGYKKWMHLQNTAEELGTDTKRMKYIWSVRWSDSHFRALETIHQMLYAILEDLNRMRSDDSFDAISRQKAKDHYLRMTDKTYLIVLHEFLDILSTFKVASLKLQESSSTLVGKAQIIYDVLTKMEDLQANLGSAVKSFLENVACVNMCDEGDCTLNMYDACPEVIINGVTLENHHDVVMDYAEVRAGLFNNIITSIKKYFSLELLESFEIFNPKTMNFQKDVADLNGFYKKDTIWSKYIVFANSEDRVKFVCNFYGISGDQCDEFVVDWKNVISCLANSGGVALENPEDSSKFWPFALSICLDKWTPITKQILGYVLVTPYSSSEVERGFSVMNNVKTKGRSRMDKITLDALMTVMIIGPDVEYFNVYEYTIEFLRLHTRADDYSMNGGKRPAEEKLPSMFSKSRIY